ncbi:MAG: 4Fe-4S binding protein [Phycisphaerae bacterium]|nr:4Fe-4S binding protein [Phycisphaerae bacterium]
MRELVVISGKGGTGKTSLSASFAVLTGNAVLADCDVDAADLSLVLPPEIERRAEFRSGRTAVIRPADCVRCGACLEKCRFGAVVQTCETSVSSDAIFCQDCDFCERSCSVRNNFLVHEMSAACGDPQATRFSIDPLACEGCGVCVHICPAGAIDFPECSCGEWFVSRTRCGPLVHARLAPAAENSGKLVSLVRAQARELAQATKREVLIIDGAPGIGCPVIASLTGATAALIVTEPTVSGRHDLERVAGVARHFGVPAWVCVNKWDLNPAMTEQIEAAARVCGIQIAGRVRYDQSVTAAQIAGRTIVEFAADGVASEVRAVWDALRRGPMISPSRPGTSAVSAAALSKGVASKTDGSAS